MGSQVEKMKTLLVAFVSAMLFAPATADVLPASICIGAAKLKVEPPGSSIAGFKSMTFPVSVTNTSRQSIWFCGVHPTMPFHRIFARRKVHTRWVNHTMTGCGVGAGIIEIAPGATATFTAWIDGDETGHEVRVDLDIYQSQKEGAKPIPVRSKPTLVR